jgi:hypothetical protein
MSDVEKSKRMMGVTMDTFLIEGYELLLYFTKLRSSLSNTINSVKSGLWRTNLPISLCFLLSLINSVTWLLVIRTKVYLSTNSVCADINSASERRNRAKNYKHFFTSQHILLHL